MVNETARTKDEAIKLVCWVELLDTVEKTRDHVVTARSLTTRKNYTYVYCSSSHLAFCRLELDIWHTVSVREEILYFFLICN